MTQCPEWHTGFAGGPCQIPLEDHHPEGYDGRFLRHKTNLGKPLDQGGWVWVTQIKWPTPP